MLVRMRLSASSSRMASGWVKATQRPGTWASAESKAATNSSRSSAVTRPPAEDEAEQAVDSHRLPSRS